MKRGDYVDYNDGSGLPRIGRVAGIRNNNAFVCFHTGCTAAACDISRLTVIEPNDAMKATPFGHHRFDADCPDYDREACGWCCTDKGESNGA